jgi:replicative DNA helicase
LTISSTRLEQDTAMPTARPLHAVPDDPLTDQASDWDQPMALGSSRPVPPFPVDALPDWMAAHVTAVAELTQTPPDLAGCLALVALSTAAGGRVRVEIRPGWSEPVNLYSVVVLPPASRKSAVFKAMTRPIRMVEKELVEQAKVDIEAARIGRRAAQEFADRAEKAVLSADGADRDAALEAAVNAAMQVDKNTLPKAPRLIADDATPEVVATLLADHGGRIAVLSAEGGLFGTLAGRYSGAPNLDVFLKGHAGDLHLVDRQGREATAVEEPAITLGLTIQPSVLDGLARNESFRGTGLLARIMYSLPVNTVGNRISRPTAPEPDIGDAYDLRIRSLVRELAEWTDPAVLVFTPAADDLMADLQDEIEPRLHPVTGSWAHLGDWGGKQAGLTARIAALLHLAHNPPVGPGLSPPTSSPLPAASPTTPHTTPWPRSTACDPVIDDAHVVLDWIKRTQPNSFTVRELFTTASRARFKKVADLAPALDLLEQHGHIHQVSPATHSGRGRKPSPTYYVHPTYRAAGQS